MTLANTWSREKRYFGDCRFRQSISSCLQVSSPRPSTNTSSHESAFCAIGAADSLALFSLLTALFDALVALLPAAAAPANDAPRPLVSGGTPVDTPPT